MVDWTTLSMYVARAIALLTAIPFHEWHMPGPPTVWGIQRQNGVVVCP